MKDKKSEITEYVTDQHGRKGIVTRSPHHPGGIFIHPVGLDYVEHAGGAQFITATWATENEDGSYSGRWADDPPYTPIRVTLDA